MPISRRQLLQGGALVVAADFVVNEGRTATASAAAGTTTPRPVSVQSQADPKANAVMDGASHPLSTRFSSLTAANAVFPGAKSLTEELDFWSIQTALDRTRKIVLGGGTAIVHATVGIPAGGNREIAGEGSGVTTIKMRDGAKAGNLQTVDWAHSNPNITLRRFSVDGNKAHVAGANLLDGILLVHADNLQVEDVEAHHVNGRGIHHHGITGSHPVQIQSWHRVYVHDCNHWGLHNSNGVRKVNYSSIFACRNGTRSDLSGTGWAPDSSTGGALIDHSEAMIDSMHATDNGMDGIWFRNLFANDLRGLRATHNARHGIRVLGLVDSVGGNWLAQNNGVTMPGRDIWFDGTTAMSYGVTTNTELVGIIAGPSVVGNDPVTPGNWPGNETWAIFVDDSHRAGNLDLSAVRTRTGSVGKVRLPSPIGSLTFRP
jgi:hypothetical protein